MKMINFLKDKKPFQIPDNFKQTSPILNQLLPNISLIKTLLNTKITINIYSLSCKATLYSPLTLVLVLLLIPLSELV